MGCMRGKARRVCLWGLVGSLGGVGLVGAAHGGGFLGSVLRAAQRRMARKKAAPATSQGNQANQQAQALQLLQGLTGAAPQATPSQNVVPAKLSTKDAFKETLLRRVLTGQRLDIREVAEEALGEKLANKLDRDAAKGAAGSKGSTKDLLKQVLLRRAMAGEKLGLKDVAGEVLGAKLADKLGDEIAPETTPGERPSTKQALKSAILTRLASGQSLHLGELAAEVMERRLMLEASEDLAPPPDPGPGESGLAPALVAGSADAPPGSGSGTLDSQATRAALKAELLRRLTGSAPSSPVAGVAPSSPAGASALIPAPRTRESALAIQARPAAPAAARSEVEAFRQLDPGVLLSEVSATIERSGGIQALPGDQKDALLALVLQAASGLSGARAAAPGSGPAPSSALVPAPVPGSALVPAPSRGSVPGSFPGSALAPAPIRPTPAPGLAIVPRVASPERIQIPFDSLVDAPTSPGESGNED